MPIIKKENLIAVKCNNGIICLDCKEKGDFCDTCTNHGDSGEEMITINDIAEDEILICDNCKAVIYEGQ